LLMVYQRMSPIPTQMGEFHNMAICYGEEPSAPLQTRTPKIHPLSAVRDCLFNVFAVTLHIGGRSSIRNLGTRHAVVTGTHFTCMKTFLIIMRVFPCFSSVVKEMPGYNPQRRGTARNLQKFLFCSISCLFCVVLCIVCV
jgi:hypothetical protein